MSVLFFRSTSTGKRIMLGHLDKVHAIVAIFTQVVHYQMLQKLSYIIYFHDSFSNNLRNLCCNIEIDPLTKPCLLIPCEVSTVCIHYWQGHKVHSTSLDCSLFKPRALFKVLFFFPFNVCTHAFLFDRINFKFWL